MKRTTYRKPHRYKKKRPIVRKRFFWFLGLTVVLLGGIFYCLFFLEIFQVEKIIVSGEQRVSKEEIEFLVERKLENKFLFWDTKSIFALNIRQIRQDLLDLFPQIAEAEVSRGFFDAVNILVIERASLGLWCQEEICFLVDGAGIIFEEASPETELLKIESSEFIEDIALGKAVFDKEKLEQIFYLRTKLAEIANISIVKAFLVSAERLNIETTEGWEIYFNLKGDLDWQMTELALVLEKQISPERREKLEYIDLRFSRVFYK